VPGFLTRSQKKKGGERRVPKGAKRSTEKDVREKGARRKAKEGKTIKKEGKKSHESNVREKKEEIRQQGKKAHRKKKKGQVSGRAPCGAGNITIEGGKERKRRANLAWFFLGRGLLTQVWERCAEKSASMQTRKKRFSISGCRFRSKFTV